MEGISEDDIGRLNYSDPFASLSSLAVSDYGVVLVAGLDYGDRNKEHLRHDLCLYVLETLPEIEGAAALIVLLEDLLQARSIYHTIRHRVMSRPGQFSTPNEFDWMWNLPYTYWPCDAEQLADVREWIRELQGKTSSLPQGYPSTLGSHADCDGIPARRENLRRGAKG